MATAIGSAGRMSSWIVNLTSDRSRPPTRIDGPVAWSRSLPLVAQAGLLLSVTDGVGVAGRWGSLTWASAGDGPATTG